MNNLLRALYVLGMCATLAAPARAAAVPETAYLFAYFINNGEDGLHLAWSADGMKWQALNGGKSYLKPDVGKSKLMRDPCITTGPDGTFHMVWTDSWDSGTIGYASSKDLLTWSAQMAIPVMAHEPATRNCWAPEIAYDANDKNFRIFWASTVPGKFAATDHGGTNDLNHRMYSTTTKDFVSFSQTSLYFDPGHNVIDSTLIGFRGKTVMVYKDETKVPEARKNLKIATAGSPAGPFTPVPGNITPPGSWVEGPAALHVGKETFLYFDAYTRHRYEALATTDFQTWRDASKDLVMPAGARHGTALAVPGTIVRKLMDPPGSPREATEAHAAVPDFSRLRNPVWSAKDNLRDPSVIKTAAGYRLFYSRFSGGDGDWGKPANWAVATVFTRDFSHFGDDHDVSPKGFASPGDVVKWHGRWVLPYQSYPASPTRLRFSVSEDLEDWSAPEVFLEDAAGLPWNTLRRVIDPTFVVDGETLHCYFVGSAIHKDPAGKEIRANLMGHAITRDPDMQKWEILSRYQPLIGWSARAPDGVENTMVIKTGAHWTMIFSEGLADQHLAMATSDDLRTWNYHGPIDIPRQQWTERKFGAPFVWREGAGWVMILMGTDARDRTTFGLLTSPDGKIWTMLPDGK